MCSRPSAPSSTPVAHHEAHPDRVALPVPAVPGVAHRVARFEPDRRRQRLAFVGLELTRGPALRERALLGLLHLDVAAHVGQRLRGIGRHPGGYVPFQRARNRSLGGFLLWWPAPDVHTVDAAVGHQHRLGADHAGFLGRDADQTFAGLYRLGDRGLDGGATSGALQKRGYRYQVLQLTAHGYHGRFSAQRFHQQPVVGHSSAV